MAAADFDRKRTARVGVAAVHCLRIVGRIVRDGKISHFQRHRISAGRNSLWPSPAMVNQPSGSIPPKIRGEFAGWEDEIAHTTSRQSEVRYCRHRLIGRGKLIAPIRTRPEESSLPNKQGEFS